MHELIEGPGSQKEVRGMSPRTPEDEVFEASSGTATRSNVDVRFSEKKPQKLREAINRSSKKVKQTSAVSSCRFGQQPGPDDPPPIECS
jgi:hypothetical protein